jgi:predicted NUDIX family NTP pyrophosphohydrolase
MWAVVLMSDVTLAVYGPFRSFERAERQAKRVVEEWGDDATVDICEMQRAT